jgi:hypothetical protein
MIWRGLCDKQAIIHEYKKVSFTDEALGICGAVHQNFGKLLFYLAKTQAPESVNDPMLTDYISHIEFLKGY